MYVFIQKTKSTIKYIRIDLGLDLFEYFCWLVHILHILETFNTNNTDNRKNNYCHIYTVKRLLQNF